MKKQWSEILTQLQDEVPSGVFKVWLAPLQGSVEYLNSTTPTIRLIARSAYASNWVKDKLLDGIKRVSTSVLGAEPTIIVEIAEQNSVISSTVELAKNLPTAPSVLASTEPVAPTVNMRASNEQAVLPFTFQPVPLTPSKQYFDKLKYSFNTFVVGPCNQLAHAAAKNILLPNTSTEMLFLSSAPGLGKTHITQALGKAMYTESKQNHLNMAYLTAEDFSSQFIQACRFKDSNTIKEFKDRFSYLDLLLLEDIHILNGKTKTQEELLSIVKRMQDRGGKVVFTSSLAPKDLRGLDSHLTSRFCSGFVASLDYPDFDTKKDMLIQKAFYRNFTLPESVADVFAQQLDGDVRLLESSLNNLLLKAQTLNLPITPELAYSIIAQVAPQNPDNSLTELLALICSCFDITEQQLTSTSRKQDFVMARNTAFYLMRKHFALTMQDIGSKLGRRHSTVSKAVTQVEAELMKNSRIGIKLKNTINAIESRATFINI